MEANLIVWYILAGGFVFAVMYALDDDCKDISLGIIALWPLVLVIGLGVKIGKMIKGENE